MCLVRKPSCLGKEVHRTLKARSENPKGERPHRPRTRSCPVVVTPWGLCGPRVPKGGCCESGKPTPVCTTLPSPRPDLDLLAT